MKVIWKAFKQSLPPTYTEIFIQKEESEEKDEFLKLKHDSPPKGFNGR